MAAMGTSLQLWEPTVCDSVEELQQAMALLQNVDISQLPEAPKPPSLPQYDSAAADLPQQLQLVQRCIESMQYNHTGEKWFTLRKDRGISGVLSMVCALGMPSCFQRLTGPIRCCRVNAFWKKRSQYNVWRPYFSLYI